MSSLIITVAEADVTVSADITAQQQVYQGGPKSSVATRGGPQTVVPHGN
jgi:hypothetical protein